VAEAALVLYQAEWCPFSSAVRQVLTELGIDFVARQVEPWPEQRTRLAQLAGEETIPVLETEDGTIYCGTRAIFDHLRERAGDGWQYAAQHRRRFADHRDARESGTTDQLLEYFRQTDELEAEAAGSVEDAVVVEVPEANRYELRLDGRLVGLAAYRRRNGRLVFTHTEVADDLEGRGFGSKLARAALDDARTKGLEVVPLCPFIAHYIKAHPAYEDLIAPSYVAPST
jgi:predicted GNAT family acetyltransferase/glutaredoxin